MLRKSKLMALVLLVTSLVASCGMNTDIKPANDNAGNTVEVKATTKPEKFEPVVTADDIASIIKSLGNAQYNVVTSKEDDDYESVTSELGLDIETMSKVSTYALSASTEENKSYVMAIVHSDTAGLLEIAEAFDEYEVNDGSTKKVVNDIEGFICMVVYNDSNDVASKLSEQLNKLLGKGEATADTVASSNIDTNILQAEIDAGAVQNIVLPSEEPIVVPDVSSNETVESSNQQASGGEEVGGAVDGWG